MLSIMFRSFPHRLSPYLSRLLKLLLIIVSNIAVMLENRDEVENVHIERLKDGRIAALKVIIEVIFKIQ